MRGTGSQCMLDLETEKNVLIDGTPLKKFILLQHISDAGSIVRMIAAVYLMRPFSGVRRPAIRWSSVDFPHPEGPTRAINSPSRTEKVMSFRA